MPKRVTLKEVAAHAGVSYQTVSKVIHKQTKVSDQTAERIWTAVRALGYHPDQRARDLHTPRRHTLGYSWSPSSLDQANAIPDPFLRSMMQSAERAGYHIFPFRQARAGDPGTGSRELINTSCVDGFSVSGVEFDDARISYANSAERLGGIERLCPNNRFWRNPVSGELCFGRTVFRAKRSFSQVACIKARRGELEGVRSR